MKHIPNLITAANLFLGSLAIIFLLEAQYPAALWCFLLAILMDWLDGMAARLLRAYSELGKQLDSLADMVSFGLLPGAVWYVLLAQTALPQLRWLGLLYTVATAFRLAKFNIDERQTTDFLGLPSPSAAILSIGYFYWWQQDVAGLSHLLEQPWLALLFLATASLLMVIEVPMFSLKVKRWTWKGNEVRIIFAGIAVLLLIIWQMAALPLLILIYILISLLKSLF